MSAINISQHGAAGTPPHLPPLSKSTPTALTHSRASGTRTSTTTLGTNAAAKPVTVKTAHGVTPTSRTSVGRDSRKQAPETGDPIPTAEDVDAAAVTADNVNNVNVVNAVIKEKAVDTAGAAAATAGGATMTPTAVDQLSHSSREVPLGEAALLGLSHCLIPVSTMELFFAASICYRDSWTSSNPS